MMISVLLLLFLIMAGKSIGAYKTNHVGSTQVRTAFFSCTLSSMTRISADSVINCNLSNDVVQYSFVIKNQSEVDVSFAISAKNVPSEVQVGFSETNGTLFMNGGEKTIILTVGIPDPDDPPDEDVLSNIMVEVCYTQID